MEIARLRVSLPGTLLLLHSPHTHPSYLAYAHASCKSQCCHVYLYSLLLHNPKHALFLFLTFNKFVIYLFKTHFSPHSQ